MKKIAILLTLVAALLPKGAGAAGAHHVHVVLVTPGGVEDPCHSGETTRTVPPYGYVYVIACTYDEFDQPVSTLDTSEWIRWLRTGPVTITQAETETTEVGQARATIRIEALGTGHIAASLCPDLECASTPSHDSVLLSIVHQDPTPPVCDDAVDNEGDGATDFPEDPDCESASDLDEADAVAHDNLLTIRFAHGVFGGRLRTLAQPACGRRRLIRLKKVGPGADRLIGHDRTGRRGYWSVLREHPRGRFYAVAPQATRTVYDRYSDCPRVRSLTIALH